MPEDKPDCPRCEGQDTAKIARSSRQIYCFDCRSVSTADAFLNSPIVQQRLQEYISEHP